MADTATYDVFVIGGGPGGYVAAIRAAQLGFTVGIVDKRKELGGTCLNIGCIPSKALLDSSELYSKAEHEFADHGIGVKSLSLDLRTMMNRKDAVVSKMTGGVATLMKRNKISVHHGTAVGIKTGGCTVRHDKGEVDIKAESIILATGSVPVELPFLPFDGEKVVSSTEALSFPQVPKRLLIVGAGAIGLELGSVWSRLGSDVEVVEIMPEILPGWDDRLAKALRRELTKQGLSFRLKTKITGIKETKDKGAKGASAGAILTAEDKDGNVVEIEGDRVLVAVGRRAYFDGVGVEEAAITTDKNGRKIEVNDRYETSVKGIYAIGDLIHGPMLAHKAEDEGIAVAEIIAGKPGHVNYETIPGVVYTWPEAAAVGLSEERAKEQGTPYRVGSFPFGANGRAVAMGSTGGMVRIIAHQKTDRVLGAHIVGPWASDLLAEIVSVMEFGGSAEDIARTVHSHPTLTEAVKESALAVDGRAISTA